ncbi:MAG: hypothetical protein O7J95_04305 [Planctomycetota bacterium]|nr:hypothetical protein [Planctomycetota bacterium]
MESKSSVTDTVFVIKEEEEHCFLFDGNDPLELLRVLYRQADETDGLSREEVTEVLEGVIPGKLRSI